MPNLSSQIRHDPVAVVLFAGLALGLVCGIFLSWLPLSVTLSHFVFEDSLYYLRVARSIINGNGPTFDGVHSTNGFHPLWMLVSISLSLPFEAGSSIPVHLLLSLCAVLHVLTGYLLYETIALAGNRTVAALAGLFWLFNYNTAGIALCGLETALFAFLLLLTVRYYISSRRELAAENGSKVGFLVALTALARFDGALLGLALAADQLMLALVGKEPPRKAFVRIVPMSAVGCSMMIPWMVWSWSVSRAILPNSHRALSLWIGSDARFGEGVLTGVFNIVKMYVPEYARLQGLAPLSLLSSVFLVILIVALAHGRTRQIDLPVLLFLVYPAAQLLYYTWNYAPLNRYLYPGHLVVFTAVASAIGGMAVSNRHRLLVGISGIALLAVMLANITWSGVTSWKQGVAAVRTHSLHSTMYRQAVPWIGTNVEAGERVGAFNCGIYGYFSGRTVVNLDGVINDSVIPYLEQEQLIRYLYEERITYVVDWETALEAALGKFGGVRDYRERFTLVHQFEQSWGPYSGARLLVLRLR